MSIASEQTPDFVTGDATGLPVAAHGEALRRGGPAYLTEIFRAFGALAADNRVTRITQLAPCGGGSTGAKLFLSVEYERPDPNLHQDLFVKFSRNFNDPVLDARGKYEMQGEIRFAPLSRLPGFPIQTPATYFADTEAKTHTSILITERIAFGQGAIEPQHGKCLDHHLADPLAYYRLIMTSLARIAAAHRTGRLVADIDALFPYDPVAAAQAHRIALDEQQVRDKVARCAAIVARSPQLFPANLAQPAFYARLEREAVLLVKHQDAVNRFQQSDPNLIALCHWNGNIDNAYFWRDDAGERQCGLMDWGHCGQMNLAFPMWGCLSAAGPDIWNNHLDELLTLFVDELRAQGGPQVALADLKLHIQLYMAVNAVSYFLDSLIQIPQRMPEVVDASGPFDPMIQNHERTRNQLHISCSCLNVWERGDLTASLEQVLARMGASQGALDLCEQ